MAQGGGYIDIHDITTQWGVYALAGPNARALLKDLVKDANPDTVLSNKRFPWLSYRDIELGMCPVRAVRVAYTGELGWELHYPIEFGRYLWDLIWSVGEKHGLKGVGARAQNWLRQEKSYRAFGTELGRDATPLEAGLDRFVDLGKDFQGKAEMLATGIRSRCVTRPRATAPNVSVRVSSSEASSPPLASASLVSFRSISVQLFARVRPKSCCSASVRVLSPRRL